jgi:small subunit ribosomal protein S16
MVKIRLRRTGAKKQPHYRVVVADSKSPRDGKFIETIGHYNPRTEPPTVEIDAERALYWLSVGAQPSAAVKRMLDKMGLMSSVTAVRKGEESIDDILAQFVLTKPDVEQPPAAVKEMVEEAPEVEAAEMPVDQVEPVEEAPEDEEVPAEAEEEAPEDEEAPAEAEEETPEDKGPEDEAEPAGAEEDLAEDVELDEAEEPADLEDDEADDVDED